VFRGTHSAFQGSEPIYLHLIRPLVKPYTRTLDATLDVMLTLGDFIFALSTYPLRIALQWWHQRFGRYDNHSGTDTDSDTDSSNSLTPSDLPSSFIASTDLPLEPPNREGNPIQFPRKTGQSKSDNRRPSASRTGSRNALPDTGSQVIEGDSRKQTRRRGTGSTLEPDVEPNFLKPHAGGRRDGEGSSNHQIWYPPEGAYLDDDRDAQGAPAIQTSDLPQEPPELQTHVDEWREYPPFPSAYPPTPIAMTSRLVPTSMAVPSSLYPSIEEENVQQDFHKSLLPPREPLNPSPAGDLSDEYNTFGIPPFIASQLPIVNDADDSMSTDGYEDEDDFNITLRTPLQPQGSFRSKPRPRLFVSPPSISSIASRSSALTTADNGSSLRTDQSSDSPLSAPKQSMASLSVIGKKRSYPRSKPTSTKKRVRQIEEDRSYDDSLDFEPREPTYLSSKERLSGKPIKETFEPLTTASDTAEDLADTASSSDADRDPQDPTVPEEKRRRVVRSPPRVVHPSRPIRTRVARYASSPPQAQKGKLLEVPPVSKRSSGRLRAAGSVSRQAKGTAVAASSSGSASDPPLIPPKPVGKSTNKKR